MATEAVGAGFVEVDYGTGTARFRRIQILTIEGLMTGAEHPELPVVDSTALRRARREEKKTRTELDLWNRSSREYPAVADPYGEAHPAIVFSPLSTREQPCAPYRLQASP